MTDSTTQADEPVEIPTAELDPLGFADHQVTDEHLKLAKSKSSGHRDGYANGNGGGR